MSDKARIFELQDELELCMTRLARLQQDMNDARDSLQAAGAPLFKTWPISKSIGMWASATNDTRIALMARAEKAETTVDRLTAALRRYGWHEQDCRFKNASGICNCGLDAALAPAGSGD